MSIQYDEMTVLDYPDVFALWQNSKGIGLSGADTLEAISTYLARNPGHSFVARHQAQLVGAVLCGHDGRRGWSSARVRRLDNLQFGEEIKRP